MTGNVLPEQNLEKQIGKQMGCMAGFLQIFDRHQILSGKRLYSTKRLPRKATPVSEMRTEQEKAVGTPVILRELDKQPKGREVSSAGRSKQSPVISEHSSPVPEPATPTGNQSKSSLPLPIFECKEGSARSAWKFKEAPRLSLDSRAVVDAKGSLKPREIRTNASILFANRCESNREEYKADDNDIRRSPSVIARLMGLEPLPDTNLEPDRKVEPRRTASEARGRDLFQHRFADEVNFHSKQSQQPNFQNGGSSNVVRKNGAKHDRVNLNRSESLRNARTEPGQAPVRGMDRRKCFYDSADFFPERKQTASIYGEIEKRLTMRGIDEPSKDLETLKQILEALQLKGLLRTKKCQTNNKNFVYQYEESLIVVIKPGRQPASAIRRIGKDSRPPSYRSRQGPRRNLIIDSPPTMSPRRDRREMERNSRNQIRGKGLISSGRNECGARSPNRRGNGNVEQRRVSPVQSTRVNGRRTGLYQTTNRLPPNRKTTTEIYDKEEKVFIPAEDQTSTVSEGSINTSSQTDTEKSKVEDYRDGKILLERCDKLLHSTADMAAATAELQPSPVSVLDSSFYKEESSPSPVMKWSIHFKDQLAESDDEMWSPAILPLESKSQDKAGYCDFIYISDILRAFNCLHDGSASDVFLLLEKQQYVKGKDTSKVSRLQRKLIFDTINEILDRKKQLPPWKLISITTSESGETSLQQIWSEFQKIREWDASDDLVEAICGVLRKDLAEDAFNGWEGSPIEMSETVLDIERLIFPDLISETIGDLAALAWESNNIPAPRRKLVF